jgi:hypothetical protein
MSAPDENGWYEAGEDFEHIPNDCFDVIAKYYDAGLDQMMMARFAGCVRTDSVIYWGAPFPNNIEYVDLLKHGYRPTHWRLIPEPPVAALQPATDSEAK